MWYNIYVIFVCDVTYFCSKNMGYFNVSLLMKVTSLYNALFFFLYSWSQTHNGRLVPTHADKNFFRCVCWFSGKVVNIWDQKFHIRIYCNMIFKFFVLIEKKKKSLHNPAKTLNVNHKVGIMSNKLNAENRRWMQNLSTTI